MAPLATGVLPIKPVRDLVGKSVDSTEAKYNEIRSEKSRPISKSKFLADDFSFPTMLNKENAETVIGGVIEELCDYEVVFTGSPETCLAVK